MPRVVILGGGFAGMSAARELERLRKRVRDLEVVLVDRHNFMLFTPMLPEVAGGSIEFQHITEPYRAHLRSTGLELAEVLSVDETRREVTVRHPLTGKSKKIAYDELIFALGSAPSTMGVEGVERCTLPLRTLTDAQRLRNAVIGSIEVASQSKDVVERDRLLRFIIAGGGFTGVETAGELSAFVRSVLHYYPAIRQKDVSFVLIQGEARLLPHLPARFGKHAARVLRDRGIEIRVGTEVQSVDPAGVTLEGGERYDSRTIVWAAGSEPAPFVKRLGFAVSRDGAIVTRRDCSIDGRAHLWAIGDCAAIPKRNGGTYAPLAQNAIHEGAFLARNVIASLRGKRTKDFAYRRLGQMASLGDRHAIAELPGGVMLTGTPAWMLWRLYYLGRLPGASRKTRVALDWTLEAAFGPALTRTPLVTRGETSFESLDRSRTDKHETER